MTRKKKVVEEELCLAGGVASDHHPDAQKKDTGPRIRLVDTDSTVAGWHETTCGGLAGVSVHCDDIFAEPVDALISPANSYGFMDGGIDALYTRCLGLALQERLQKRIDHDYGGELLIGEATIVPTGNSLFPWLIAAPTMRVPSLLRPDSVAPYHAMRAVLRLVRSGSFPDGTPVRERVQSIAVPGLGTGVGGFPSRYAARQVRQAIEEDRQQSPFPRSWWEASCRHQHLFSDQARDLQFSDTLEPEA